MTVARSAGSRRRELGVLALGLASAALLVAALPINIGYSRFAWDACETTLATLIACYFALQRKWWALALAFVALVWVHPTNAFVIVPLAGAALGAIMAQADAATRKRDLVWSIGLVLLALAVVKGLLLPSGSTIDPRMVFHNVLAFDQWLRFALEYGRLMSGVILYRYIVDDVSSIGLLLHDLSFGS